LFEKWATTENCSSSEQEFVVANVHREPIELKTERNESCGLVLIVCLDEDGMVEVENSQNIISTIESSNSW
jgi:hypothetical protein